MQRFFFHGTSADHLQDIMLNGLSVNTNHKVWSCSEDAIYLWDPIQLAIANCEEDADNEEKESRAFQQSYESGQIACAYATDCRIVVVKVLIEDNNISGDTSCENMEDSGACCMYDNIPASCIMDIQVSNDLSLLKLFFMRMLHGRDYSNLDIDSYTANILDRISKVEIYPEDIDSMTRWQSVFKVA